MSWPWPGDSQLDRARRTARSYRDALQQADPAAVVDLDKQLIDDYGQTWLAPTALTLDLDDWITISEAAELVGLTKGAVYQWLHRRQLKGRKGPDKRLRVQAVDVLAVNRQQRQQRLKRVTQPEIA
jgi:excisionase family DNA binding protein